MSTDVIIMVGFMIILLLLTVFVLLFGVKLVKNPDKTNPKGHVCKDCLFCNECKCVYFREENIDENRPACKHYEEKEYYRPA